MSDKLIDVEYLAAGGLLEYVRKRDQIYMGIGKRHDGFTVLKVRAPGATRNHNIGVGDVYAITVDGRRHVLETPRERWQIRAQELHKLIDGSYTEEWAADYFSPSSPNYFKRRDDYEPEIDAGLEAAFADPKRVKAVPSYTTPAHTPSPPRIDPTPNGYCLILASTSPPQTSTGDAAQQRTNAAIGLAVCASGALLFLSFIISIF